MNIAQIEENVKALLSNLASGKYKQDEFIYELLLAYGHRKQSVSRLRSGERNMASKNNEPRHDEIIWKRNLYYKHIKGDALHAEIDRMRKEKLVFSNKLRFVIVTNFNQLLAYDIKTSDSLDINIKELPSKFDFFLPWAGMEKAVYQGENPADVKAAEKMAKLFDLIKADNFDESNKNDTEALHGLNIFLTRLLFCFFAEDTEIFQDNQFSHAIQSHTKEDGSDLSTYLDRLFLVLNTANNNRQALPDYLANFPYVNGGLFADVIPSPSFSARSRRMLIECGSELNWSDINPDIFGSMIQAVVHPDQRGGMGMHYTSVTNIMKVIEPLFLNDLYEKLEKSENSATKLQKLQQRLAEIKIFDPACGSGNFLIIAYKELRKLEMEVLKRLQEIEIEKTGQISQPFSVIKLSQFYGIELDDFAHEVAVLSLWLAEHQMNVEFKVEFGEVLPALPLQKGGNVFWGNACQLEWGDICEREGEIFILGNPPYLGGKKLSEQNKLDMDACGLKNAKLLDYIGCWFMKASTYIRDIDAKYAFVSTKSICQGEQVSLLWPHIFSLDLEIDFAHTPFNWTNSAKDNAGVTCIIVGVRNNNKSNCKIFYSDYFSDVKSISPYLIKGGQTVVIPESTSLSWLPPMCMGSNAIDGKRLVIEKSEYESLITQVPEGKKFIRRYMGATDFLAGKERYCLWIDDNDVAEARRIDFIRDRLDQCKSYRKNAGRDAKKVAHLPHRFCYRTHKDTMALIFPRTTTERRVYVPTGFISGKDVVINEAAFAIYNAEPYILSLLSSRMHYIWFSTTSGRLRTGFRYSVKLSYNTFIVPSLSDKDIQDLNYSAMKILSTRESYPHLSLSNMYDPDKMPKELLEVHIKNDRVVESIYKKSLFKSDEERLECLIGLYEQVKEKNNA